MRNILKPLALTAVLGLTIGAVGRADAAFITYTETTTASGSLGATNFTNALVTLTGTADTNAVTSIGTFVFVPVVATFTVANVGSGTITDPVQVATAINGSPQAGFIAKQNPSDPFFTVYLSTRDAAFAPANYDLRSTIGPITGPGGVTSGFPLDTTAGVLVFSSSSQTSTFSATGGIATVPEPSSLALCGIAGLSGLGYAWRRRRLATAA